MSQAFARIKDSLTRMMMIPNTNQCLARGEDTEGWSKKQNWKQRWDNAESECIITTLPGPLKLAECSQYYIRTSNWRSRKCYVAQWYSNVRNGFQNAFWFAIVRWRYSHSCCRKKLQTPGMSERQIPQICGGVKGFAVSRDIVLFI